MNDSQNIPEVAPQIPRGAVSIYGQGDAMDDFPVLKAFQQYVDAEHAKAQKRMTTLCIFFVVLMVAVIGVFMMLLMSISQRNNSLSDQLFQVMLKDRDRQNVIVQTPGQQGDSSALLTLQKQLFDQQLKMMEETVRARTGATPENPVSQAERAEFAAQQRAHEEQVRADGESLRKLQEQLKAERERIAAEQERLRQKEIDLQRRNLYPEFYARQDQGQGTAATTAAAAAAASSAPAAAAAPEADDDLSDVDAAIAAEERNVATASAPREDGSIRYFADDDEDLDDFVNALELPSQSSGRASSGWSMPEE